MRHLIISKTAERDQDQRPSTYRGPSKLAPGSCNADCQLGDNGVSSSGHSVNQSFFGIPYITVYRFLLWRIPRRVSSFDYRPFERHRQLSIPQNR